MMILLNDAMVKYRVCPRCSITKGVTSNAGDKLQDTMKGDKIHVKYKGSVSSSILNIIRNLNSNLGHEKYLKMYIKVPRKYA